MKKRQHYVPRFYLKNFARKKKPNSYKIRCFDKSKYKAFEPNINDVALEKFFYDKNDPPVVENILSFLEHETASVLKKIIQEESIENLTGTEYTIISCYILIQHERTKSSRIRNIQIAKLIYKDLYKNKPELNLPPLNSLNREYKKWLFETRAKKAQFKFMFSTLFNTEGEESVNTAKKIFDLDWILGLNHTNSEFYTSDHPIHIHNPDRKGVPLQGYGQYAFYLKGVRIYFPLSPKLCLILYDGKTYPSAKRLGARLLIDRNELDWINTQIIAEAFRMVFSKRRDFQFVKECISKYPELRDPFRNRIF